VSSGSATSTLKGFADSSQTSHRVREVPCVDGSELAREIFTSRRWSVQPCVRPVSAVHMTAGHNALRGSGPGQNPAFDNALAHVGCPDRRIDRLCITCCSPSQPSHHAGMAGAISFTPQVRRVPCSARPWPSSPTPCARAYWRARWRRPWSVQTYAIRERNGNGCQSGRKGSLVGNRTDRQAFCSRLEVFPS
jgi:hypothetical protein